MSRESPEVVDRLARQLKISNPIGIDSGSIAQQFQAYTYPTTVVIGADGRILLYRPGSYSDVPALLDKLFRTGQ
jgi:hypothetical protein